MPKTIYLFLTLAVFLLIQNAGAQSAQKISFSCFYWQNLPEEDLFYRSGKKVYPLEFKKAVRSSAKELEGVSTFEIYRRVENAEEGEPPFALVGKTAIPLAKKVLFVVIPVKKNGATTYDVFAIDDSLLKFPAGSFQFVNFTNQNLHVRCGKKIVAVNSKNVNMIKPDNSRGGFVSFEVFDQKRNKLVGTRIFGQPKGREMVFISPAITSEGRPRLKFVTQLVAPETQNPKLPTSATIE